MRMKCFVWPVLIGLSIGLSIYAQPTSDIRVNIFGPQTFTRSAGTPSTQTASFTLPSMAHGPFTMTVTNGDAAGRNRISSGTVEINGVRVLGPSDFNQNVAVITRIVELTASNTLAVELASAPGALITVSVGGLIATDSTTAKTSASVTSAGGQLQLPGVAQLTVPAASVPPAGIQIDLSTVTSPFMDFLLPELRGSFTPLPAPKIRVKAATPLLGAVRLKLFMPGLAGMIPAGKEIAVAALITQAGSGGEQIVNLAKIGGSDCGNHDAACVTLLPQWFTTINPADPNDPVIQVEVGFQPQSQAALHVWTVDSVQPLPGTTITLGSSDSLTFTAQFNLAKNFSFAPISPAVGTISSHFGPRDPSIGAGPFHQGIDFALNVGSAVRAVLDGSVTDSGCQTGGCDVGYGLRVYAAHGADRALETVYAHLNTSFYSPPTQLPVSILGGQLLGLSGQTGNATGPSLHFGVQLLGQWIDPEPLYFNDLSLYLFPDVPTLQMFFDGLPVGISPQPVTTLSTLASFQLTPGQLAQLPLGIHTLILELDSTRLGVRTLAQWTVDLENSLTVAKNGTGSGTVTSAPAGINCGPGCTTQSAPFSGTVQLNASAASGSAFAGWSGDCAGTSFSTSITMTSDKHCVATFNQAGITISVTVAGSGNIKSNPPGIDCGGGGTVCTASFPFGPGALINLDSNPAAGNFLESFTGCAFVFFGSCGVLVQSDTQNVQIGAAFLQYALAINSTTCDVIPGAGTAIVRMVVSVQATGGVGTYITDPSGQAAQACGAWSGPTGLFGISCARGSGQPSQSTFQFTEDHLVGPYPFINPVTFGTQVFLSTTLPIPFPPTPQNHTMVVNGPSCTVP